MGRNLGVRVIAGVEFSAAIERGELHLLGYGVDPDNQALAKRLSELRETRRTRAVSISERLAEVGIDLPRDLVERMGESESIGRPHIARELVRLGVVESVSEGFDRYLGRGKPGFVSRALIDPEEVIQLVRGAGGVAVMAHPYSVPNFGELVPKLVDAGLSGIECYYGGYDIDRRLELASLASDLRLLATGGSDYHGPNAREGRDLGAVEVPSDAVEALLHAVGHG
ncbi:PHP domain-containing protein [soil metagenome]